MVLLDRFGLLGTVKVVEVIKLDLREAPNWLKFGNWQFKTGIICKDATALSFLCLVLFG